MNNSNQQDSMAEVLDAINQFASMVETRFSSLESEMNKRFSAVDDRFSCLEEEMNKRFNALESEVGHMRVNMVTKDYLDDKLADFRLFNHKLLSVLEGKKVVNKFDVHELRQLT